MAITTEALLASAAVQRISAGKINSTSTTNITTSMWATTPQGVVTAGSYSIGNTTTGVIPDVTTTGAVPFTNPSAGNKTYITKVVAGAGSAGTLIIYDRLWHGGNYSVTTTANSNTTTAITRGDTTGKDCELWLEVSSALGANSTVTVTYNDANNASQSASVTTSATVLNGMHPFIMPTYGIRNITNVVAGGSTTGSYNLVIMRRLCELPIISANTLFNFYFGNTGMPIVADSACLAFCYNSSSNGTGIVPIQLTLAQG